MSAKLPRVYIILLTKNAEKHIIDWISWHLALGIHRVIVADAGSTDGTKAIIQDLAFKWPVELFSVPLKADLAATERRLLLTRKVLEHFSDKSAWILFLDVDEYLCPDSSLATLLERANKTGVIALRWCFYSDGNNRQKPQGHIVATHGWRADVTLPDHKFVRILARLSALKRPSEIMDPITLDLPTKHWTTAMGKPWSIHDPVETLWQGGRILHYICSDYGKPLSSPLSSLIKRYYNHSHIRDITGIRHLAPTRLVRNRLCQTLFSSGMLRLKKMVAERQWLPRPMVETDLSLPDEAERFGFSYRRIRLEEEEDRLLSPQAFPPADTTRAFILRTPSGAMLEADGDQDNHRVMLCLIQNRYPQLAMFFCMDRQPFTFSDIISFDNFAVTFIHTTFQKNLVTLPLESGRDGLYFETISSMEPQIPVVLPLPVCDEHHGLSLRGFLEWLYAHPEAQPYDIRRGLLLLTKEAAHTLGQNIPSLQPFMASRFSA